MDGIRVIKSSNIGSEQALLFWKQYRIFVFVLTPKKEETMSMVFRFRMLSDENDRFVRDYEVLYDMTLLEFHEFLLEALEYEPCMASFFTADDRWEKLREFTLMDMGDGGEDEPEAMDQVTLGQIIHRLRDRLIYLFDLFNERAYYLELTGAYESDPTGQYPRTTPRRR